jgi:hypothetical protein
VRALLKKRADPTIADNFDRTPMAIAKKTDNLPPGVTARGRRECVEALEVRCCLRSCPPPSLADGIAQARGAGVLGCRGTAYVRSTKSLAVDDDG